MVSVGLSGLCTSAMAVCRSIALPESTYSVLVGAAGDVNGRALGLSADVGELDSPPTDGWELAIGAGGCELRREVGCWC